MRSAIFVTCAVVNLLVLQAFGFWAVFAGLMLALVGYDYGQRRSARLKAGNE